MATFGLGILLFTLIVLALVTIILAARSKLVSMGNVNISINGDAVEDAERIYAAFADGGVVRMEMQETFFARRFAMVTDRFGTPWMLTCAMGEK